MKHKLFQHSGPVSSLQKYRKEQIENKSKNFNLYPDFNCCLFCPIRSLRGTRRERIFVVICHLFNWTIFPHKFTRMIQLYTADGFKMATEGIFIILFRCTIFALEVNKKQNTKDESGFVIFSSRVADWKLTKLWFSNFATHLPYCPYCGA